MTVRFQGRMRSVVNQLDGFPGGIGHRHFGKPGPVGVGRRGTPIPVDRKFPRTSSSAACLIVIVLVSLPALPMGTCFPLGLRLFREYSSQCLPWMWDLEVCRERYSRTVVKGETTQNLTVAVASYRKSSTFDSII